MRHNWVRDIANFAKYGLLKRLAGTDLRLGVFWYLTTHGEANRPLVGYLSKPDTYRPCDCALFDTLCRLHSAKRDALTFHNIERGNVLPNDTVFYSEPLCTTSLDRRERRAARQRWFDEGYRLTQACDLIFLDQIPGCCRAVARPKMPTARSTRRSTRSYRFVGGQSVVCVQFGAPGNFERKLVIARQRLAALRTALAEFPRAVRLMVVRPAQRGFIVAFVVDGHHRYELPSR